MNKSINLHKGMILWTPVDQSTWIGAPCVYRDARWACWFFCCCCCDAVRAVWDTPEAPEDDISPGKPADPTGEESKVEGCCCEAGVPPTPVDICPPSPAIGYAKPRRWSLQTYSLTWDQSTRHYKNKIQATLLSKDVSYARETSAVSILL